VLLLAQALAKYAFGLGLLQMFLCTLAFSLFSLPVGKGIGTQILEVVSCRLGAGQDLLRCPAAQQLVWPSSHCGPATGAERGQISNPEPRRARRVQVFRASPQLAAIRSVDEAVVIGVALSLSSSAFVLQLLNERGEMATKFGSATLGILLMQARPQQPAYPPACNACYALAQVPAVGTGRLLNGPHRGVTLNERS
jgi:hypothetical protein